MLGYTDAQLLQMCGASGQIVNREDLHFQSTSSNKVYIAIEVKSATGNPSHFFCLYGRYNASNLQSNEYTYAVWLNKLNEKKRKGYQTVGNHSNKASQVVSTPVKVSIQKSPVTPSHTQVIIWPMGAATMPKDPEKIQALIDDPEFILEYKYDGVRATIHIPESGSGCRLFGRNATVDNPGMPNEFTVPHIEALDFGLEFKNTILDGELLSTKHNTGHEDAAKISGDLAATDGRDLSHLYFVAFDILFLDNEDLRLKPWKERRTLLTSVINVMAGRSIPFKLSYYTAVNKEEFYNKIIAAGGEGAIFKNINAPYSDAKKLASVWVKWKKEKEDDFVIIGFTDAEPGKYNNVNEKLIGAVRIGQYTEVTDNAMIKSFETQWPSQWDQIPVDEGKWAPLLRWYRANDGTFCALAERGKCSGMTDIQRRDFTARKTEYIGQVAKITYHKDNTSGLLTWPRFAYMRPDKNFRDCIYTPADDKKAKKG